MNFEEVREFQIAQQEIVAMIGAFLSVLKSFNDSIVVPDGEVDLSGVRRTQPIVSDFVSKSVEINQFCTKYHCPTYYKEIIRPASRVATLLGNQTLQSKQLEVVTFKQQLESNIEGISEVMIATAQIISPPIDANIKANNSFSAYCFISSVMDGTREEIIIIDPYIDRSIFYRYLYRLPKEAKVKIVSDSGKLRGARLNEFEAVEVLFKSEYTNYTRELRASLHDRYLINETNAYSLGGSIKDAAKKSDYSVVQLTEEKRAELCVTYS